MGIGAGQGGFGCTTGQTVLDETSAISPVKLEQQIKARIDALKAERDRGLNAATQRGVFGTTTRDHQILDDAIANVPQQRASEYLADAQHLRNAGISVRLISEYLRPVILRRCERNRYTCKSLGFGHAIR